MTNETTELICLACGQKTPPHGRCIGCTRYANFYMAPDYNKLLLKIKSFLESNAGNIYGASKLITEIEEHLNATLQKKEA